MRNTLFLLFASVFFITGCTETQLVSHAVKRAVEGRSSSSEGSFKVGNPYEIAGKRYVPQESYNYSETGIASWYGPNFHGKKTANGEIFDMSELTAAHRTLQIPSLVRVTNLENGRSIILRVNDRGPFKRGRIIDVSKRGAELLGFKNKGVAKVKVQVLSKESMAIAQAAKRGEDTSGVEVAMNENRLARTQGRVRPVVAKPTSSPVIETASYSPPLEQVYGQPVESQTLAARDITGHVKDGNFLPDPVVKQLPVGPANIYVQAGSFGNQANAQTLASSIAEFGQADVYPALVDGKQFYRVRIGPISDVRQADIVLANLADSGRGNAMIVVD